MGFLTFKYRMLIKQTDFKFNLSAALLLYVAVLLYQGYQYGQSDQSQIIPVLFAQDHPEYYTHDHYVNSYLNSPFNERTIFHALFRYMGYSNPLIVFVWHALFGIILILAWINIAGMFIKNVTLRWLAIALLLIVGFHTSTGSNELYYNLLVPSLIAKAFASWGLYYWLNNNYKFWICGLIIATLIQPLVGLQLFILTSISLGAFYFHENKITRYPWLLVSLYCLICIPLIILLSLNNGGHNDPATFMQIVQFRLSHHFFGITFGIIHLCIFALLSFVSFYFYTGRLRLFFLILISGCFIYEFGVELLNSTLILYSQWWKTTIWMEAFGIIAITRLFEKQLHLEEKFTKWGLPILLLFIMVISFYRLSGLTGEKPVYNLPLMRVQSDEIDISNKAFSMTPIDAVFLVPPDLSAFKWYAKRSMYVDYKSMVHNEPFLIEWYRRIMLAYNYSTASNGNNFLFTAKETLSNPGSDLIETWKKNGITHIISPSQSISTLELIAANGKYVIYRIP